MAGAKPKTIRKVIRKKVEDWLSTITDDEVRKKASQDLIVTGGCIASLMLNEKINDFDFYFRTLDTTKAVAEYYVKKFNENREVNSTKTSKPFVKIVDMTNLKGETERRVCVWVRSAGATGESVDESEYSYYESDATEDRADDYINSLTTGLHGDKQGDDDEAGKYRPVFMSQNAISLSHSVQLVIRFYGEPDEIHDNYDFVHAKCSYDYGRDVLDTPTDALTALLSRSLIYEGSLYPICSVFRAKKFLARGWRITAGELLKICWQISEMDLNDIGTLREQLTGCDVAYMYELIELINEAKSKNPNKDIDSAYITKLVDVVFNT